MSQHAQLLEDHDWVHRASAAVARRRRDAWMRFHGSVIGLFAGIGLTVVVVLIYAHRHGWLY